MESHHSAADITLLLEEWREGRGESFDRLITLLYQELHQLAGRVGGDRPGETLQATVIVHELYLRLRGQTVPPCESREHFLHLAARAMRHIRIDHARRRAAERRGGGIHLVPLEEAGALAAAPPRLEDLDEALAALEGVDPRKASLLDLRYFAGFSMQETAAAFALSPETVRREMRTAEAWLLSYLSGAA